MWKHTLVHSKQKETEKMEKGEKEVEVVAANLPKCPNCKTNNLQQQLNRWFFQCLQCGVMYKLRVWKYRERT